MEIRAATASDHEGLFTAFARIVEANEGFPQRPPLTRSQFNEYWIAHTTEVVVLAAEDEIGGAYYLKPNFVGRGAHIANAGYFVLPEYRGKGAGRALVEHSLDRARRLGFDALQFNLVFESNPARKLYEELGFREIGRIPRAIDDEDALIYWRAL
jgi:GNAT superfamily N-acetyltransferase